MCGQEFAHYAPLLVPCKHPGAQWTIRMENLLISYVTCAEDDFLHAQIIPPVLQQRMADDGFRYPKRNSDR